MEGGPSDSSTVSNSASTSRVIFALNLVATIFCFVGVFYAQPAIASQGDRETATTPASVNDPANSESQRFDSFRIQPPGHVKPLQFGGLLTFAGNVGRRDATEKEAGFDVTDARLLVAGELEKDFGYLVQAEFTKSTPLLDLILHWKAPDVGFRLSAGYFRTPFSAELLIPAPRLDFIERSQVVRALAPARQIGVQLDQRIAGKALVFHAGVFNGNGLDANDDDRFLYLVRVDGKVLCDEGWELDYGANAAYSEDENASIGIRDYTPLNGRRWIAGGDIRATHALFFFSAEAIFGFFDDENFRADHVWGYQASAGWQATQRVQLLARYDAFHAGNADRRQDRDVAIASLNLDFTKIISLQFELRVPTRGVGPSPGGVVNLNATF